MLYMMLKIGFCDQSITTIDTHSHNIKTIYMYIEAQVIQSHLHLCHFIDKTSHRNAFHFIAQCINRMFNFFATKNDSIIIVVLASVFPICKKMFTLNTCLAHNIVFFSQTFQIFGVVKEGNENIFLVFMLVCI